MDYIMYRIAGWQNNAGAKWTYGQVCHIIRLREYADYTGDERMFNLMTHMLMSYVLNEPAITFNAIQSMQS